MSGLEILLYFWLGCFGFLTLALWSSLVKIKYRQDLVADIRRLNPAMQGVCILCLFLLSPVFVLTFMLRVMRWHRYE